jgi:hypothetical protein
MFATLLGIKNLVHYLHGSLSENPLFLKNFTPKNNTLNGNL